VRWATADQLRASLASSMHGFQVIGDLWCFLRGRSAHLHDLQQPDRQGAKEVGRLPVCSSHPGRSEGFRITICQLWTGAASGPDSLVST